MTSFDLTGARALVLGGTGHIGSAIARRFAEAGAQVTVTGAQDKPRPNLEGCNVETRLGDDRRSGFAEALIAQSDLVVDAATPYPIWMHDARSDPVGEAVARADRLLAAAQDAGAAFIHISSFTTLQRKRSMAGQAGQGVLRGLHRYFDLKVQVEKRVATAMAGGVKGTILNPATVIGPYDLKPREQCFVPMLLTGQVQGLVHQDMNVVDVRDVAEVAVASVGYGYPHQRVPVFGHSISLVDLAGRICARTGQQVPRFTVPSAVGVTGLAWMETAFAALGRKPPWPSLPMMLLAASYAAEPSLEQRALHPGLRPLENTIGDAITWYRKIGYLS